MQILGIKSPRDNIMGKSTLVDYAFVIHPYLDAIKQNIPIEFTYFSFEMDRVTKEFDFAVYFLYHDYKINTVFLPTDITVEGKNYIDISSLYLRGMIQDDNGNILKIDSNIFKLLQEVYEKRIVPMFGRYNDKGQKVEDGVIDFVEFKENPTGLRNYLIHKAEREGIFMFQEFTDKEGKTGRKRAGYIPNDPTKFHIVITDTIRKIPRERGFSLKETIDKYLEYSTELRNLCLYTFIHIVHLNRSMTDTQRMKFLGDMLYPTPEDIKDTGNLSEECNHLFTMFNPNDERYNLTEHFGIKIKDNHRNELYPNMRTLHLVESRHVPFPQHFRLEMQGNIKNFNQLKI